jgi:hypothetical protein
MPVRAFLYAVRAIVPELIPPHYSVSSSLHYLGPLAYRKVGFESRTEAPSRVLILPLIFRLLFRLH